MDHLETIRIFAAVAEARGFAAAARRLSMSAPMVTRAVAALEARLGTELLKRTTRTVRLTEAGARFLSDARRILAELAEAERFAADLHAELRGRLSVTASVNFGRMFVTPVVLQFLELHPQASVRTFFVDRIVDLLEEGMDVAVRIGELPDSTLSAIRVGTVRRVVCASPLYLAERGAPKKPADLAEHPLVAFSGGEHEPEWGFAQKSRHVAFQPHARLLANVADVALAAAVAGKGLTRALSYQVEDDVRAGRLVTLLRDFEPPALPVHVVHTGGKRASAKVRAFVELAVERLKSAGFS